MLVKYIFVRYTYTVWIMGIMCITLNEGEMSTIGEKLRKLRQEKGLSLDELAKITQSSKSYLWELEKGTKNPSAEKLSELAKYFGVTLDYLMKEDENQTFDTAQRIFTRVNNLSEDDQKKIESIIETLFSDKK